jgi:hypothetical protein
MHVPAFKGGVYRASASRILEGDLMGYFDFDRNRAGLPDNLIPHDQLRSLRALRVFGSWTNDYDLHRKNTMDVIVEENGKKKMKHYLLDFGSSLGSSGFRPKVPAVGFENLLDIREIIRAIGLLKVEEKPWEKRWDKNKQAITSPSIGYFDNKEFDPGRWKSNLPHYTFEYLTSADGYWAAKIISRFTDEDIAAVVKTGQLSDKSEEDALIKILTDRRDMVAVYWFNKVSPLENFYITGSLSSHSEADRPKDLRSFADAQDDGARNGIQVSFDDLAVQRGWAPLRTYEYRFYSLENGKKRLIEKGTSETSVITLPLAGTSEALLEISAVSKGRKRPPAKITFETTPPFKVTSIEH